MPIKPMDNPPPAARSATPVKKAGLASVIGLVAASLALTFTPEEESGRTVKVEIADSGQATVTHLSGKQYLQAYLDMLGIPTACDGITRDVRLGQRFTEAQCAAMLEAALVEHAKGMMACSPGLRRQGVDYQRAGSLLTTYNIGVSGFCGSTANRLYNAGNYVAGCEALKSWNKGTFNAAGARRQIAAGETCEPKKGAPGVFKCTIRGLRMRRGREVEICQTGIVAGKTPANLQVRMDRWR